MPPGTISTHLPATADYGSSLNPVVDPEVLSGSRADVLRYMDSPSPVYTPEMTEAMLGMIRRRGQEAGATRVAGTQSDIMARGGTGSSTELFALEDARRGAAQDVADQELAFMLEGAKLGAQNRQFNTQTALSLYGTDAELLDSSLGRQFNRGLSQEEMIFRGGEGSLDRGVNMAQLEEQRRQFDLDLELSRQYFQYLDEMEKAERKRSKRRGVGTMIGTIGGATIGGFATGGSPQGIAAGGQVGSTLGFLFE